METIDAQVVKSVVPWSQFQFAMSPSSGASGGILFVWNAAL